MVGLGFLYYISVGSVCISHVLLPENTYQYLSQIKSDLHDTFRISSQDDPTLPV